MTFRGKLLVALGLSSLLGCIVLLCFHSRTRDETGAGPPPAVPAPGPGARAVRPGEESAPAAAKTAEGEAAAEASPRVAGGVTITGRVLRTREGGVSPVRNAVVRFEQLPRRSPPQPPFAPRRAVTGADGRFEVGEIPRGTRLGIEIDDPSSALLALRIEIVEPGPDGRKDLGDLHLEPGSSLAVRLVGPEGEPIDGARITVYRHHTETDPELRERRIGRGFRKAEGRGNGEYLLARMPPGLHSLGASAKGFAPARDDGFRLPREEPLTLRLEKGRSIGGVVLALDGTPIGEAEVWSDFASVGDSQTPLGTDASGRFLFDSLGDVTPSVHATAEGRVAVTKERVPFGTEDLEIRLAPEAALAGTVVAEDGGEPIGGVEVRLEGEGGQRGLSAITGDRGAFEVRKLSAASYQIVVDHDGHAPFRSEPLRLQEGERSEGMVIRLQRGFDATVKVSDGESGDPIASAKVYFHGASGGRRDRSRSAEAGPDGVARIRGLSAGTYELIARANGFFPGKPQTVEVREEGPLEFTMTLEKGGSIAGRVVDAAGEPIPGAELEAQVAGMDHFDDGIRYSEGRGRSDPDGRFSIGGLESHSRWEIRVRHRDFAPGVLRGIAVEVGATAEVEIRLSRGGTIRGRVLDPEGRGIAGARVLTKSKDDAEAELAEGMVVFRGDEQTQSDGEGNYSSGPLKPGSFTVKVEAANFEPASREGIEVGEGAVVEGIDLVLAAAARGRGRVVDLSGGPVSEATVSMFGGGQNRVTATSDADGRFQIGVPGQGGHGTIEKPGYAGLNFEFTGTQKEEVFTLRRLGKIAGEVRARGRDSFPPFHVSAVPVESVRPWEPQPSGVAGRGKPTGRFEIEAPEGRHRVGVNVPGFAPAKSAEVLVGAGERLEGIVIDLTPGGTLEGLVVRKGSGGPLARGSVQLYSDRLKRNESAGHASTGTDGSFRFEDLAEGTYDAVVSVSGHRQAWANAVRVRAGETAVARLELEAGIVLSGRVTWNGAPVSHRRIHASRLDVDGEYGYCLTDAAGDYSLQLPGPGRFRFQVETEPRNPAFLEVTVPPGMDRLRRDLEIPTAGIRGAVVDAGTGKPLSGAWVHLYSGGGASTEGEVMVVPGAFAQSDADGRFSFANLARGTYLLKAVSKDHAEGQLDGVEATEVRGGREARIALEGGVPVTLKVRDRAGNPLGWAFPVFRNAAGELVRGDLAPRPEEPGTFPAGHLLPGEYRVSIYHHDFVPEHLALKVEAEPVERTVALRAGGNLCLTVTDLSGAPVEGAEVEVLDAGGASAVKADRLARTLMSGYDQPGLTAGNGTFIMDHPLRPGTYRAVASKGASRSPEEEFTVEEGQTAEVRLQLR